MLLSNYNQDIDAVYTGFPDYNLHFYKVKAKFPDIGEPALEILHLNAYLRHVTINDWQLNRAESMMVAKKDIRDYSTKSISGKYNSRILEFVKSFTQHFNSKTSNSLEALTIKEIELHLAIDKYEIIWLLDTQNIRLKIEDRTLNVYVSPKKKIHEDEEEAKKPIRERESNFPLKSIIQLDGKQLAIRNKTDNKKLL